MPRNSSGTYSLPIAPFTPGTVISSAAVNSDFSDIATALTGSVASNGVTTITGQLKSSVTASPAYSSTVDLTTGFGVSAAGTAAIYAGGSIVATATSAGLQVTGGLTVSGSITAASFNFSGTGAIQIPAGTTAQRPASPVIGDIRYNSTNGNFEGSPDATRWDPMSHPNTAYTLTASVGSGLLTVSLLNALTGASPTAADPVSLSFQSGAGSSTSILITSALTLNTNGIGATLGSSNGVPFRFWVVAFASSSTGSPVLGIIKASTSTNIVPLIETIGYTAVGISNAATSALAFYCPNGISVTAQTIKILGYLDYASGLATAGNYASGPTNIVLFNAGSRKPGDTVQMIFLSTSTALGLTGSFAPTAVTASITLTSTPNLVVINATGYFQTISGAGQNGSTTGEIRRGTTTVVGQTMATGLQNIGGVNQNLNGCLPFDILDVPGVSSAQAYTLYANTNVSANFETGTIRLTELMG